MAVKLIIEARLWSEFVHVYILPERSHNEGQMSEWMCGNGVYLHNLIFGRTSMNKFQ